MSTAAVLASMYSLAKLLIPSAAWCSAEDQALQSADIQACSIILAQYSGFFPADLVGFAVHPSSGLGVAS